MLNQNKSYEDIPEMIGQLLTIHQKEIDRIAKMKDPTNADIKLSLSLMKELQSAYLQYRVLKEQIKAETRGLNTNVLTKFLQDNNMAVSKC